MCCCSWERAEEISNVWHFQWFPSLLWIYHHICVYKIHDIHIAISCTQTMSNVRRSVWVWVKRSRVSSIIVFLRKSTSSVWKLDELEWGHENLTVWKIVRRGATLEILATWNLWMFEFVSSYYNNPHKPSRLLGSDVERTKWKWKVEITLLVQVVFVCVCVFEFWEEMILLF